MSQLKSLASQTAIYGVSSILGRVLNYALVPLHTTVFNRGDNGNMVYLYTWVAFLMIIYTFGMETTMFRFSNKETSKEHNYFHYAGTFVLAISLLFTITLLFFNEPIADYTELGHSAYIIRWLAIILLIDSFTSIAFAKLRLENQARKFALIKLTSIIVSIGLQVVLLIVFPGILKGDFLATFQPWVVSVFDNSLGIGYVFLANLIASIVLIPLLYKSMLQFRLAFDKAEFATMLNYAFPIVLTGLAGIASERIDVLMLNRFLPDSFYSGMNAKEAIGLYGQTMKLSIFMILAIQAFRYAGEPFFFSQAKDKNSPQLFAKVLHYFVLLSFIIFVGVSLNVQLIGELFLRKPEFREALYLVPLLLFGRLLYGVYINVSIWFKLNDKTIYGTYFSVLGAVITIVANIILIPLFGFDGSAIAMVICYLVMVVVCYHYGQKYYPIPYKFKPLVVHGLVAVILVYGYQRIEINNQWVTYAVGILGTLLYTAILWLFERKNLATS